MLEGEGTIVADGTSTPPPPAPSAATRPEVKRTIRNNSDAPIRVLLIGVPGELGLRADVPGAEPRAA